MHGKLLVASAATILLSGCSLFEQKEGRTYLQASQQSARISQVDLETKELLRSISDSLVILSETRQGSVVLESTPEEMKEREWLFNVTPPNMGVPMTISNFRGHPISIIQMLAAAAGYTVEEIGTPSANVRNVSANYISRPIVEILRSVAFQMGCDGLIDPQGANSKIVVDWSIRQRGSCE